MNVLKDNTYYKKMDISIKFSYILPTNKYQNLNGRKIPLEECLSI